MNTLTRYKFFLVSVCLLLSKNTFANLNEDFSVWGAIQAQGSFLDIETKQNRWLWWLEGQGRFSNDASRLGQSIIRPGIGYQLSENISIWSGYAWIFSSPTGKEETNEHRIWQQLSWKHKYSWGKTSTRTRLEQRFLNNGNDVGWRYRQLIKYTHPISSTRYYLSIWDEVFININTTDWGANSGFGQNRFFAGVGIFIDPDRQHRLEIGYLNQFIHRNKNTDQMNHIISISLALSF